MSPLDRLEAAHEALISALDDGDAAALDFASAELRAAARAAEGYRPAATELGQAIRIAAMGEAAQGRVNFLTEANARRVGALAAARGDQRVALYGRQGK
ncbi:MAG: hypothetical protein ACK4K7_07025 [Allosphingosinicella sp.]|uniref:hypothetical protein n=1 Tax=Allosphingosinicella sp. TaxID=2823234 RepID=UPI0039584671